MGLPLLPHTSPPATAEPESLPNYLTDGRRLLRVVARFQTAGNDTFASLEDCLTLEVRPYSPGELAALHLRPVQVAAT